MNPFEKAQNSYDNMLPKEYWDDSEQLDDTEDAHTDEAEEDDLTSLGILS
jgi:hypothetical protein